MPDLFGFMAKISSTIMESFFGVNYMVADSVKGLDIEGFRKMVLPERQLHQAECSLEFFEQQVAPKLETSQTARQQAEEFFQNYIQNNKNSRIFTYLNWYQTQQYTPTSLCLKLIENIKNDPTNSIVQFHEEEILKQAGISTLRYQNNQPRLLEGVTFVCKEMCHAKNFYAHNGLKQSSTKISTFDCILIEKLKAEGAIFVGLTNMHQLGLGCIGVNPAENYSGGARNPYDLEYFPSGSSSGSATAVASNLVCFSLGNDGGGSIRLPAATNGLVGLKATWGRISASGETADRNSSLLHTGPMTRSVADNVLLYGLLAGNDEEKVNAEKQMGQPLVNLMDRHPVPRLFPKSNDQVLKIGYYQEWAEKHSKFAPKSFKVFKNVINQLEQIGSNYFQLDRSLKIPELFWAKTAHAIIFSSECLAANRHLHHSNDPSITTDLTPESKIFKLLGEHFTGADYLQANKQRKRMQIIFENIFKKFDLIVMPTLGNDIESRHVTDEEVASIRINYTLHTSNFTVVGNILGIPCLTLPIGTYASKNGYDLPVGLQIMAPWWREDLIFDLALKIEQDLGLIKKPENCYFEF